LPPLPPLLASSRSRKGYRRTRRTSGRDEPLIFRPDPGRLPMRSIVVVLKRLIRRGGEARVCRVKSAAGSRSHVIGGREGVVAGVGVEVVLIFGVGFHS
jgi:hypothetical protein